MYFSSINAHIFAMHVHISYFYKHRILFHNFTRLLFDMIQSWFDKRALQISQMPPLRFSKRLESSQSQGRSLKWSFTVFINTYLVLQKVVFTVRPTKYYVEVGCALVIWYAHVCICSRHMQDTVRLVVAMYCISESNNFLIFISLFDGMLLKDVYRRPRKFL